MEDPERLIWRKSSRSGSNGGGCVEVALIWRKSSWSGDNGGGCVEAASLPDGVLVRDSTDPHGPVLGHRAPIPAAQWQDFLASLG